MCFYPFIFFIFCMFRMNHAQLKSYESDVGTKTTHHVMYPESAKDLDNSTHLVLFPFKIQDLEWLIESFTTGFNGTWVELLWIRFSRFALCFCRPTSPWLFLLAQFVAVFLSKQHVSDNANALVLTIKHVNVSVLTWAASD